MKKKLYFCHKVNKMPVIDVDEKIYKRIVDVCRENNIEDIEKFINETIKKGLNILCYGETPFEMMVKEKQVPQVKKEEQVIEEPVEEREEKKVTTKRKIKIEKK